MLARRLLWVVPVVLIVVVVTFALMHLAPGSPWHQQSGGEGRGTQLSEAAVRNLEAKYGLDRPWGVQLLRYLANVARFDFGNSYQYEGERVRDMLVRSWPPTLVLGTVSFVLVVPLGIGLGVVAALRHNKAVDYAVSALAVLGAAVPNFVVGILLISVFSVGLSRVTGGDFFLPAGGYGVDRHLVLPIVTLSLLPLAFLARLSRAATLETLGQDHVRTARAKGVREGRVATRHVLKSSLVPAATALGPLFVFLLTGSVVIETLYQIPGMGGVYVRAVGARDYPVILGASIVYSVVFALANLAVDVLYALLDPRIRLRAR